MVIVQINITMGVGSTGKIVKDIDKGINSIGDKGYVACMTSNGCISNSVYEMYPKNFQIKNKENIFISRITGRMGYRNKNRTRKMLKWIEDKEPDIIHLHNIHGNWLNIKILFDFIKKKNYAVVWTLHDCWSFTGRCSHFEFFGCDRWKTGCFGCKQKKVYPITYFFDFSKYMWQDKKLEFTGISNALLVVPSEWLNGYVKQSYLKEYKSYVVHNCIDIGLFKPTADRSSQISGITQKIILGVASSWSKMKGLDDFVALDKLIDHSEYVIVLVGLNRRQLKQIPDSIVKIARTYDQKELAAMYTQARVFVNLTYQDNFPTTNLEATACGTPVITYKTGGSVESVFDRDNIIPQGDINAVWKRIQILCGGEKNTIECRAIAEKYFDKSIFVNQYLKLYQTLMENKYD